MHEEPFQVPVESGALHGHVGGEGPPALLLHGGAAVTDYMDGCAQELDGLLRTIRYQQRGTFPPDTGPPYAIEAHVADAVAVLEFFDVEQAWAIGHSWGGHLALHLAVTHPERLLGVVCIDAIGASSDVFGEMDSNLRRRLSDGQVARIEEIEARRREGEVTEAELFERWELVWPFWFADPEAAAPDPVRHIGPQSSMEVNGRDAPEQASRSTAPSAVRPRRARPASASLVDRDGGAHPGSAGRDDPPVRALPLARAPGRAAATSEEAAQALMPDR